MEKDKIEYWEYMRIDCERPISAESFPNGELMYKSFLSSGSKINLGRSYMKMIVQVTKNDGTPLDVDSKLAPSFLACDTLFKSAYYKINNVIVSEIGDHYAQVASLNKRKMYSKGYRDTVLKDLNFGKSEFTERQKAFFNSPTGSQCLEYSKPGNQASTISYAQDSSFLSYTADFNFPGGFQIAAAPGGGLNGTLQFSALPPGVVNLNQIFVPGDIITYTNAAVITLSAVVVGFTAADTVAIVQDQLVVASANTPQVGAEGIYRGIRPYNTNATITGINTTFTTDFQKDDKIRVNVGNDVYETYTVTATPANDTTLQVYPMPSDLFDDVVDWQRVRNKNDQRGVQRLECIFKLPLGIFKPDEWMIGHDLELVLYPHADPIYKQYFMESIDTSKLSGVDYNVSIENMIFYACVGHVPYSIESGEYDCKFMETRAQLQNLTSNSSIDRTFVIDRHTEYLTMAIQDPQANGANTLYSRTKFKAQNNIDLDLESYAILYKNIQYPQPKHNQENTATSNRLAQAYYENTEYCNQQQVLSDMEDLTTWRNLGAYYHYRIPIDRKQSNPKVSVLTRFRNEFPTGYRPNILFFDHFHRQYKLVVKNGRVVEVVAQSQAE